MKLGKNFNFQQMSSGLIVPVLVLIIGIGGYFIVWPKYQSVQASKLLLEQKQLVVEADRAALDQVQELIAMVEREKDDLEVLNKAIPEAPGIPELLSDFDFIAGQSGVLIVSINLSPVKTPENARPGESSSELKRAQDIFGSSDGLGIIEADVNLIGEYLTLKNFLFNLEQNLRLMDVQELNFSELDLESGLQEFNLKIHTYYQQE